MGFTILELMVAIGVFVLLAVILVGLLQAGLDTWDSGTARKDVYERAQAVFTLLTRDVQAIYVPEGLRPLDPLNDLVNLVGDFDAQGAARVRFVRADPSAAAGAPNAPPAGARNRGGPGRQGQVRFVGQGWQPTLLEVAYGVDPDPDRAVLWRVEIPLDLSGRQSLFDDARFNRKDFFNANGRPVDTGTLYFDVRYWARNTTSWDAPRPRKASAAGDNVGPEDRWDASRQTDEKFVFHRRTPKDDPPDPVVPEMVRITITLEPQVGERASSLLSAAVDDAAGEIQVASTRNLPEPPGFVKVNGEWMEVTAKAVGSLRVKRGARATKPAGHPSGAAVRAGITFSTAIPIPVYREGKY